VNDFDDPASRRPCPRLFNRRACACFGQRPRQVESPEIRQRRSIDAGNANGDAADGLLHGLRACPVAAELPLDRADRCGTPTTIVAMAAVVEGPIEVASRQTWSMHYEFAP